MGSAEITSFAPSAAARLINVMSAALRRIARQFDKMELTGLSFVSDHEPLKSPYASIINGVGSALTGWVRFHTLGAVEPGPD